MGSSPRMAPPESQVALELRCSPPADHPEATGGVPGLTRRLIELADESGCRHPAHEEEMQCPIFRE